MPSKKHYLNLFLLFVLFFGLYAGLTVSVNAQEVYPREETVYQFMDGGKRTSPNNYNYYLYDSIQQAGMHQLAIEFLFYYQAGNGSIIPWLASGYELSSDYETLTITLREGAKWSDGMNLTSKDVAFTFNMLLTPHDPPLILEAEVQKYVESVEIVDDYTVKFHLTFPNPRIMRGIIFVQNSWWSTAIVPEHIWKDVDPTKFMNDPPVWSGPYTLLEASDTGDQYVWKRNDDWWYTEVFRIRPAPKYWVFQWFATEEATSLQLITNNLDYGDFMTRGTFEGVVDKNPYVRGWNLNPPYSQPDMCRMTLQINCARYPWNNKEVRSAINHALNRTALNEISQEGIMPPAPGVISAMAEPKYLEAEIAAAEYYNLDDYDLTKVDEVLSGLGWTKGSDGVWVTENGTRATINLVGTSSYGFNMRLAIQVADQLRAAGFDVIEEILPMSILIGMVDRGDYDVVQYWLTGPDVTEVFTTWERYLTSAHIAPLGTACNNHVRWSNSSFDSIVDQMTPMNPDDPNYIDLVKEGFDIFYQELPILPLLEGAVLVPQNNYYWTNWPTSENYYTYPLLACGQEMLVTTQLVSTKIDDAIVYFTQETPRFRGVDLTWYGPVGVGDSKRIPVDDAEYWINKGYASYTPVTPEQSEIEAIAEDVSALKDSVDSLTQDIQSITGITTLLYAVIGLQFLILVVGLVVLIRKS